MHIMPKSTEFQVPSSSHQTLTDFQIPLCRPTHTLAGRSLGSSCKPFEEGRVNSIPPMPARPAPKSAQPHQTRCLIEYSRPVPPEGMLMGAAGGAAPSSTGRRRRRARVAADAIQRRPCICRRDRAGPNAAALISARTGVTHRSYGCGAGARQVMRRLERRRGDGTGLGRAPGRRVGGAGGQVGG